ncbi:fluoride efflux transporter FluC [Microbacterium amylolyticum]|uniref:Fluoride-specific ion channel FluC n=1 Tax=Microbacterium amylolyticum TaxID=936337 RepID=A0ABS4ZGM0_9MICO|nr:CrcB family protein [Microbacterium amylolyticum]MBP2436420.1 CrcB protein [Microbacterium amylolyticum]
MSAPLLALVIAVSGGVGAGLRFTIDQAMRGVRVRLRFPLPVLIINASGCFVMAFLVGGFGGTTADFPPSLLAIEAGLLGGFTTFSTVSTDTAEMWHEKRYGAAIANAGGTLVVCLGAAIAGMTLAAAMR